MELVKFITHALGHSSSDFSRRESGPPPLQHSIAHFKLEDVLLPGGAVIPFDLPLVASVEGLGAKDISEELRKKISPATRLV